MDLRAVEAPLLSEQAERDMEAWMIDHRCSFGKKIIPQVSSIVDTMMLKSS
jgi:hypothetical protein